MLKSKDTALLTWRCKWLKKGRHTTNCSTRALHISLACNRVYFRENVYTTESHTILKNGKLSI